MKLLLSLLLLPFVTLAHPGIAIVKDSKGNIYYSDLQQVWKITNGHKSIAVAWVHTHELYIDAHDNLYGEHMFNTQNDTNAFYHYLWVLKPNGQLDTVLNTREAYQQIDFSLARDGNGNEYYIKQFIKRPDTAHIYKKTPNGRETVFAKGNFKGVKWLHPQSDGSLLFVQHNNVYKATRNGTVQIVAQNIANPKPAFDFSGNSITIWGIWQDAAYNIYVAVFSDQMVKKISSDGKVADYYQSGGNWAPTHGVFDNEGRLWLMEASDKNEIRVIEATPNLTATTTNNQTLLIALLLTGCATFVLFMFLYMRKIKIPTVIWRMQ